MTPKGRRPSFALLQALELVASGNSVHRSSADAGCTDGQVWRSMKTHGQGREDVSVRAAVALAHYRKAEPMQEISEHLDQNPGSL